MLRIFQRYITKAGSTLKRTRVSANKIDYTVSLPHQSRYNTTYTNWKPIQPGAIHKFMMSPSKEGLDNTRKRPSNGTNNKNRRRDGPPPLKRRRKEKKAAASGSTEEVLMHDIETLLKEHNATSTNEDSKEEPTPKQLPDHFTEIEVEVVDLSSTGEGLALSLNKDHVYIVPFSLPKDRVLVKVVKHFQNHSMTDFIRVIEKSDQRDDSLVFCKYFNTCSGCQFQMMPYELQLQHKRRVIQKAFKHFSEIDPESLPEIGPTWASPLTQGYRTKLTPHFDGPRKGKGGFKHDAPTPDIGFQVKGRRMVLDIEDCPIGTDAVRAGWKERRKFVDENLHTFKSGATLLLRESTKRIRLKDGEAISDGEKLVENEQGTFLEVKSCVTDSNAMSTEYIDTMRFDSTAGSFFQNNNSILKGFTDFVRSNLDLPLPSSSNAASESSRYLVDAYCGSGLFTITCGSPFTACVGVDISIASIASAKNNARLNNIENATFITGNAEEIFAEIKFPPEQTSVIIDPPRKGCDEAFLKQLVDLGPRRIVYISCNVHTLARDMGWILNHEKGQDYTVDSIRGFDFFPQTYHVEGCAVMTKRL